MFWRFLSLPVNRKAEQGLKKLILPTLVRREWKPLLAEHDHLVWPECPPPALSASLQRILQKVLDKGLDVEYRALVLIV